MKLVTYIAGSIVCRQLGYKPNMGLHPHSIYGLTHDGHIYTDRDINYFRLPFYDLYRKSYMRLQNNYKIRRDIVQVKQEYKKIIKKHGLEMSVKQLADKYLFFSFHLKRMRIKDKENPIRGHILIQDYISVLNIDIDPVKAAELYAYGCEPQDMHLYLEMPLMWVQRIHQS